LSPDEEGKMIYDKNRNELYQRITGHRADMTQEELADNPVHELWKTYTDTPYGSTRTAPGVGPYDEGVEYSPNLNKAFELFKKDVLAGKNKTYSPEALESLTPEDVMYDIWGTYWFRKPRLHTKTTTLGKIADIGMMSADEVLELNTKGYTKDTPVHLYRGYRYDIDPGDRSDVEFMKLGKPADAQLLRDKVGYWGYDVIPDDAPGFAEGGPVRAFNPDEVNAIVERIIEL